MKRLALAFIALPLLVGCGGQGVDTGDATPVQVNSVEKVAVSGDSDTLIYDVTLNDGTRCVVTDAGRGTGGISCDFNQGVTP